METTKPTGLTRREALKTIAAATALAAVGGIIGHEGGIDTATSALLDPTKEWVTRDRVPAAPTLLTSRLGLSDTHEPLHERTRIEVGKGEYLNRVVVKGTKDVIFDPNFDPQHSYIVKRVALSPNGSTIVMDVDERGAQRAVEIKGELEGGKYGHENRVPQVRTIEPGVPKSKVERATLIGRLKASPEDKVLVLKVPETTAVCFDNDSQVYVIGGGENGRVVYVNDPENNFGHYYATGTKPIVVDVFGSGDVFGIGKDRGGKVALTSTKPNKTTTFGRIARRDSNLSKALSNKLIPGGGYDVEAVEIQVDFKSQFPDLVAVTGDGKHIALQAKHYLRVQGKNFAYNGVLILDTEDEKNSYAIIPSDFSGGKNGNDKVEVVGTHNNNVIVMHREYNVSDYRLRAKQLGLVVLNAAGDRQGRLVPIQIPNDVIDVTQYDSGLVAKFYGDPKDYKWLLPLSKLADIQAGVVKPEDTKALWQEVK